MKLNEWLDTWLNKYLKTTIKLRTYLKYNDIINKHINPILGEYELDDLNGNVLQDFVLYKLNNGNLITSEKLADNSVIAIVSLLKQALRQALFLGISNAEYTAHIKIPMAKEKEIMVFNRLEQQKLESYCLNSKPNYIGIIICLYTGIRLGELLALTWNDIDFDNKLLRVNKTVYTITKNGKNEAYIDKPKTKQSNRIIPLPKQIINLLKRKKKESISNYIISTKNGGIVQNRSYQKSFKSILNRCEITYKNFHSLRHTFATRALELGMDVKTLSEILGHKNSSITLNRYSHSLLEHKFEFMNKVGKLLDISI
mgnify:FL=1